MKRYLLVLYLIISAAVCGMALTQHMSTVSAQQLVLAGKAVQETERKGEEQGGMIYLPYMGVNADPTVEFEAVAGEYLVLWKRPDEQVIRAADAVQSAGAVRAGDATAPIVINGSSRLGALGAHQTKSESAVGSRRVEKVVVPLVDDELSGLSEMATSLLESYRNNPDVLAVEPNYIYHSFGRSAAGSQAQSYTQNNQPNDPDVVQQWGWGMIRAFEAWDVTAGSEETIIAIIDSGVSLEHPDLINKLVAGYDFVEQDSVPDDEYFHGTHVAGIAAAQSGNGIGGAGMCPNCKIMPIRVLDEAGSGTASGVVPGIYYAIDNGADVINLSLGKEGLNSKILEQAVRDAWQAGVFVICAADNMGRDVRSYPAAYAECVAVAATMALDVRADFSQYGRWVELAAPGAEIYSAVLNGEYGYSDGTSMAAPHVAGLAGLLSSQGLSNSQIRQKLCESADPIDGTASEWTCGRINALAAVTGEMPPEPQPTPIPTTPPWQPDPEGTPTPTPPPTPTPLPATELIPNGGFEEGLTAWYFSVPEIRTLETSYDEIGSASAKLGGENNSTDTIFQDVLVPIDGMLSYYWGAMGADDSNDSLQVEIEVLDGLGAKFVLSHDGSNGTWYRRTTRLSSLAGEMIRIRFSAITDDREPRAFYVDNVSLK